MNVFEILINLGYQFLEFTNKLWEWFTTPFSDLEALGIIFTPLDSLPYVGTALIVAWLIKTFVPVA